MDSSVKMEGKKKVFFITEIATFPVNGGEKIRSYGLLKLLTELGYYVIAIIGDNGETKNSESPIDNLSLLPFNFKSLKSGNKYINYLRLFRKNKQIIEVIDKTLKENSIDFVLIDYFYNGQYISYFQKKSIPVIYGTHNVQSQLILQRPVTSFKNRISNQIEFLAHRLHEKVYFSKANAVIAVSDNDKRFYDTYIEPQKVFVIPNFLVNEDYKIGNKKPDNYVIMTGNFYAYQNFVGLKWFITDIWDNQLGSKVKLWLFGHGSIEAYNKIRTETDKENIEAFGKVDDLKPFIKNAIASIVPLLHGSGSRLKCIEAMALKTPLISTSKGAEGIEHEGSISIADDAAHFRESLVNVIDGKFQLTEKAFRIFENKYSMRANIPVFQKIIHFIKSE